MHHEFDTQPNPTERSDNLTARCVVADRPCPGLAGFCDRLAAACAVARRVTGSLPDLAGAYEPDRCPLGRNCRIAWQVRDGGLHIAQPGSAAQSVRIVLQ